MHEIGMIQGAISSALRSASEHGARRVERIVMQVGVESGVDPEVIRFVFPVATRDTIAEAALLEIEFVPARCRCPQCQVEFAPTDELHVCPQCGCSRAETIAGHEFTLAAIEIT